MGMMQRSVGAQLAEEGKDMRYISTRGETVPVDFVGASLGGVASDGGLYVPERIPHFNRLKLDMLRGLTYPNLAVEVTAPFVAGSAMQLGQYANIVRASYRSDVWECPEVAPLRHLGRKTHMLELFRGPTLAFKDLALQAVGPLLDAMLESRGEKRLFATSTSGDTGPAAIKAVAGRKNMDLVALFPDDGTSPFQRRQMTTERAENIRCIALRGTFDDCQRIVKRSGLPTFNSINWLRIQLQIPYYFKAYFDATKSNDEEVTFVVPTGNSGNIVAGWYAKQMGLPIKRLILATNENSMLVEFVRSGVYRPRTVVKTTSPSQDIGLSSNTERLVYHLCGDAKVVRQHYATLAREGAYRIDDGGRIQEAGIVAREATTAMRHRMMQLVHYQYDLDIDPHTANGFAVGLSYRDHDPIIFLATASPVKFEETMLQVLGYKPELPARFAHIHELAERVVTLDADDEAVLSYMRNFKQVLEPA